MNTPICDFVSRYVESDVLRLHMPGHKGKNFLGAENLDITEIDGADSLYEASGIIRESEKNASGLFGSGDTIYSTEGSSQCIRAMLYMARIYASYSGKRPLVAAGRNAHKTFVTACAFLDFDVLWTNTESYLSCNIDPKLLERTLMLAEQIPVALYVTTPDYLGNICDLRALRKICDKYGMLLLVDNAHGAYLNFLPENAHPLALGADICCDSAHKTLPVLTGGAYLHIAKRAPAAIADCARDAMSAFGSTSPSYLILQSLDACNAYLENGYREKLLRTVEKIADMRSRLTDKGWCFKGNEPMKLTIDCKKCGYTGSELCAALKIHNIIPEFADPDYLVLMITPETGEDGIEKLEKTLMTVGVCVPIEALPVRMNIPERVMTIRKAMLAPREYVAIEESEGRILAAANVGCPPAVPIVVCGERIERDAIECFRYYGIDKCAVVIE